MAAHLSFFASFLYLSASLLLVISCSLAFYINSPPRLLASAITLFISCILFFSAGTVEMYRFSISFTQQQPPDYQRISGCRENGKKLKDCELKSVILLSGKQSLDTTIDDGGGDEEYGGGDDDNISLGTVNNQLAAITTNDADDDDRDQHVKEINRTDNEEYVEMNDTFRYDLLLKMLISTAYFFGGLALLVGGTLGLPAFKSEFMPVLVFRWASCFYITGSLLSFFQMKKAMHHTDNCESDSISKNKNKNKSNLWKFFEGVNLVWTCCLIFYMAGSASFLTGGVVLNELDNLNGALYLWLFGSVFFTMGSLFGLIGNSVKHLRVLPPLP